MNLSKTLCAVVLSMAGIVSSAHAAIQIVGTRVVYPATEREVTVRVMNVGTDPRLIQAWVDSGDDHETAETSKAPFTINPPLSRIDAGKGQSFRLMFTGAALPQDRESVFWLNVVEVPTKPQEKESGQNFLQFAIRTRIKIFYRPSTLVGNPAGSVSQLTWKLARKDGKLAVTCTNGTAYNVSMGDIHLKGAAQRSSVEGGGMCPAKGSETFLVDGADSGTVVYTTIDDYGTTAERESPYTR
ncbi:fimbria/pilus periplasmic chaperone [Lysobacter sp. MMG2]|uniref:fimbria/pilus periplasmic chaperone n=2 Tax=unclassified Lysobacter TaxID=2635362 RepID=UPI0020B40697|nr:fimbria/pilus periplasmic chaperone [Lysobacter sp. MMG2]